MEYALNSRQTGTEPAGIRVQILLFTSNGGRQPNLKVGSADAFCCGSCLAVPWREQRGLLRLSMLLVR